MKDSNNYNVYLFILFVVGFIIRLYLSARDGFLHPWDERYHALVAKHLIKNPLRPALFDSPILNYDYKAWCCNHIWLHKQPLFLWQMALSMKWFGVNLIALRLPSVILGSLLIVLVYRISTLVFNDRKIALLSAAFICFSQYLIFFNCGRSGMDHNDTAFVFYVTASILAYLEYERKNTWYWAALVGLFSGCAILNKWLTGLVVYVPWGLCLLQYRFKGLKPFLLSILCCILVFLPWQLFILHQYPQESKYEFSFNAKHIIDVIDNREGGIIYYFQHFGEYFSYNWLWLILFLIYFVYFYKKITRPFVSLLVIVLTITVFFSLLVKTKIPSFFIILVPIFYIFIAFAIIEILKYLKQPVIRLAILVISVYFTVNITEYIKYEKDPNYSIDTHNSKIYQNLSKYIPTNSQSILFNCKSNENIDIMFYNSSITAYHWTPTEEDILLLKQSKRKLYAFTHHDDYGLPPYITEDSSITIIHKVLK